MMTTDERSLLKQYMRVDHDDDDALIDTLWEAAWEYLGFSDDGSKLSWLAAAGLTLYWYDGAPVGSDDNISAGLRKIINKLKVKHGGVDYF